MSSKLYSKLYLKLCMKLCAKLCIKLCTKPCTKLCTKLCMKLCARLYARLCAKLLRRAPQGRLIFDVLWTYARAMHVCFITNENASSNHARSLGAPIEPISDWLGTVIFRL